MKQFFLSIIVACLLFTSCSSNDDIVELPKLLVRNEYTDVSTDITDYIYDENNFLIAIKDTDSDFNVEINYSENKIVSINSILDGSIISNEKYEYIGNNISKYLRYENNILVEEEDYTYEESSNKIVHSKRTSYYNSSSDIYNLDYEYNSTNNSVKEINSDNSEIYTITTFDTKKNQFSGASYISPIFWTNGNIGNNNPIKKESYYNGNSNYTEVFTNEYDADNFLIKATSTATYNSGNAYTYTNAYEYNR